MSRFSFSSCQLNNYPSHKKTCGKRISETSPTRLFDPSTSLPRSYLNPALLQQIDAQKHHSSAAWCILLPSTPFATFPLDPGFSNEADLAEMRAVRKRATEELSVTEAT